MDKIRFNNSVNLKCRSNSKFVLRHPTVHLPIKFEAAMWQTSGKEENTMCSLYVVSLQRTGKREKSSKILSKKNYFGNATILLSFISLEKKINLFVIYIYNIILKNKKDCFLEVWNFNYFGENWLKSK